MSWVVQGSRSVGACGPSSSNRSQSCSRSIVSKSSSATLTDCSEGGRWAIPAEASQAGATGPTRTLYQQALSEIRQYARTRLALFLSKKHRRSRGFGWQVMLVSSPADLGLISLYGIVVAPRAGKPWREKSRMPAVNGVGEPCAGEPHARFDAAGAGNGAPGHGH